MSETARMWTELSFKLAYLITVSSLVGAMHVRRSAVAPADREQARCLTLAFLLLALGDTGHVGFRVLAYALGDFRIALTVLGHSLGLVCIGSLATAVTLTLFYVMMQYVWRPRFRSGFGWFQYALLAVATVRFALMPLPGNRWASLIPPQP